MLHSNSLFIILFFFFPLIAQSASNCENSHSRTPPITEGALASDVFPTSPTQEDYSRRLRTGYPYEIIVDLPSIADRDLILLRNEHGHGDIQVVRYQGGKWKTQKQILQNHVYRTETKTVPDTVNARLEALWWTSRLKVLAIRRSRSSLLQELTQSIDERDDYGSAEIRIGTQPDESIDKFHHDVGVKFNALDTWAGESSYFARHKRPGAFQVKTNEAVVLNNVRGFHALHSYPDSKEGAYEVDRIFVRMRPFR